MHSHTGSTRAIILLVVLALLGTLLSACTEIPPKPDCPEGQVATWDALSWAWACVAKTSTIPQDGDTVRALRSVSGVDQ